jgi:hypothetical protein
MTKVASVERTIFRRIEKLMDAGLIAGERNGDLYGSVQHDTARRALGHPRDAGEIPPALLPAEALAWIRLPNGPEGPP